MGQRVATGAMLIVFLIILLYFGGVVMGVGAIVCLCFAMQEEYHALAVAGHRPVAWPTWLGMVLAVPLVALYGSEMIVPLLGGVCLLTMICVVFRDEPRLEDAVLSVLPLFTIVLPGMCIVALAQVQPKALQVVLLSLVFAIPVLGDTMAFFVGSRVRGPKLCPAVSPNKTISGAVAGLVGSLVAFQMPNDTMSTFSVLMTLVLGLRFIICPVTATHSLFPNSGRAIRITESVVCGIVIGFICGFIGAGGGMMMLMVLTMFLGYELKTAVGTSVFVMTFSALTGAVSHFALGSLPRPDLLVLCVVFTLIWAQIAAKIATRSAPLLLNRLTGVILTVLGIILIVISLH